MIKRISFILMFSLLLLGSAVYMARADEGLPSPEEDDLLTLINEARRNPLGVAASLGMDPEKILNDLPELAEILKEGLPPLTYNASLAAAARAHTADMFARSYYSDVSPDGRGYDERIRNTGYPAVATGESLGMLLFANFIAPADAVRFIFEYMFLDELDPARTEKRNILDPGLMELGVGVDMGVLGLGGAPWNVYLATCDYGAVMSVPEALLLNLINEARRDPLKIAASVGMDPEKILADFPEWRDLLTEGLPPLSFNTNLAEAARAHAADMLANGYYSHDSLDGRTYEDRIRETGYDPLNVGELLCVACLGNDDSLLNDLLANNNQSEKLIQQIFENIFTRQLRQQDTEEKNILNASVKEVGIGLAFGIAPEFGGICGNRVLLLVMDFGSSSKIQSPVQSATAQ